MFFFIVAAFSVAPKSVHAWFTSLTDMVDGGGMGGSGAAYCYCTNAQYVASGGQSATSGSGGSGSVSLTAAQRTQALLQAAAYTAEEIRNMSGAQIDALTGIDRVAAEIARANFVSVDGHYREVTYNADGSITIEACTNGRGLEVNIITPTVTIYPDSDCTGSCGNPPPVTDYPPMGDIKFLGSIYRGDEQHPQYDPALNTACTLIEGWTCDANAPSQPLVVDVIIDGVTVANVNADVPVPSIERPMNDRWYIPMCGAKTTDALHGFRYTLPASFKDGTTHTFRLLANNIGPLAPNGDSNLVHATWESSLPGGDNPTTFKFNCPLVGDMVDLTGSIPLVPDRFVGEKYSLDDIEVKNIGTLPTDKNFKVRLDFDRIFPEGYNEYDSAKNTFDVDGGDGDFYSLPITIAESLSPGETTKLLFNENSPTGQLFSHTKVGDWRVRVVVDTAGDIEPNNGPQRSNNTSPWRPFKVDKAPALACVLSANPATIIDGEQTTIKWTITKGTAVSGEINGVAVENIADGATGKVVTPNIKFGSASYRLVIKDSNDEEGICSTNASVNDPDDTVSVIINASSTLIRSGTETTIFWSAFSLRATSCTVTGFDIPISFTTSSLISHKEWRLSGILTGQKTYTISCGDTTASITVKVLPKVQET